MSDNKSWWEGNFGSDDEPNRRVRQNLQYGNDDRDDVVVEEEAEVVEAGGKIEDVGDEESDNVGSYESGVDPAKNIQIIYVHPTDTVVARARFIEFSHRFGEFAGDPNQDDEILIDDEGTRSYHGTNTHQCFYCRHFLALYDAISVLEERRDHNHWMVPICDRYFYPTNRPCRHCLELDCICEEITSGSL